MVTGSPVEPRLDAEQRALACAGVSHFNRGEYFECHDALEDLWTGLRGPSRDFFQGLIQIAVAFQHLRNGNAAGAASLLARAEARLSAYPENYLRFDLAGWRAELLQRRAWLADGELAQAAQAPPPWRLFGPDQTVCGTA